MIHRFHTEFAKKYGLPEAILLEYVIHWVKRNEATNHEDSFHDNRWWTFNTVHVIAESFEYLTAWQVRKALDNLVKKGALITGNYNKRGFDHTKWYTLGDEVITDLCNSTNRFAENHNSNCEIPQFELRDTTKGIVGFHNAIPIKEPIKGQIIGHNYNSNAREGDWYKSGVSLFEQKFGFITEKVALAINDLSKGCDWASYEKAVEKAHKLFMRSELPKGRVLSYVLSAAEGIAAGNDYDNKPKNKNDVIGAAEELERRLNEGGIDNGDDSTSDSDSVWGVWGG